MEYGKLFTRSVNIVWENKFLILLGILAALGSSSIGSGGGGGGGGGNGGNGDFAPFSDIEAEVAALAIGAIIAIICVLFIIALIFWAIGTIARGGLVAGVDSIESGEKSSFRQAWSAGWQKATTLLGIGILPAIPGFILVLIGLMALGAYGGVFTAVGDEAAEAVGLAGLGVTMAVLACIVVPFVLVLSILRNFAERACMLEDLGIIDSYRRGARVLMDNFAEALILFVLQVVIMVVLGFFLFIPTIIVALCCLLWPVFLLAQGFVSAALSALWTLAWRHWTGAAPKAEKVPATA